MGAAARARGPAAIPAAARPVAANRSQGNYLGTGAWKAAISSGVGCGSGWAIAGAGLG